MSTHCRIDRQSFQQLLASAFAVQDSGMDTESLSALLKLQRSIATGELDMDRAMSQVAERARNVANATGTAIALLQGDQLVYRAGSGSAAAYVGRRVTAILTSSVHSQARGEILRVENARTDGRIEASICRAFGANSLLILPIYRERAMAGVLEVLFDEAHGFQDRELQTYRLLAGLVEEAMFRDAQLDQKNALATQPTTVLHAIDLITSEMEKFRGDENSAPGPAGKGGIDRVYAEVKGGIDQVYAEVRTTAGKLSAALQSAKVTARAMLRVKRASVDKLLWNVAAAGVATALAIAGWIAYDRHAQPPADASAQPRSNAAGQQAASAPATLSRADLISQPQTAAGEMQDTRAAAFKRVRIGLNEVDYIADDVTIRDFTPEPAPPRIRIGGRRVDFGEDVTVRYFASKPDVSLTLPVSTAPRSADRSLPVSK
jgi:hypothetical protein